MAGLYLKLGVVGSLKSGNLLSTANRYDKKGDGVFCLKSNRDTRDVGIIASRIGLKRPCYMLDDSEDLKKVVLEEYLRLLTEEGKQLKVIFVDEGQLLSKHHVKQLLELSKEYSILVYGLKTDYKAQTWESINILENFAKDVEVIKNPCQYCDSMATLNLRVVDGESTVEGEILLIDESLGKSEFIPVCSKCYMQKVGIGHL